MYVYTVYYRNMKRARALCSVIETRMSFLFMKEVLREKRAAGEFFSHFLSELKNSQVFLSLNRASKRVLYFFYKTCHTNSRNPGQFS